MPVHIYGHPCDMDEIKRIAKKHKLYIVEDAAEGMGVRYKGQHVGTFGDIGIFSFNGNKIITCGGGGMIVTQNESYAKYAKYLTTQAKDDPIEFFHKEMGYNYRLTNIQAALGVAQLEQLDGFVKAKVEIANRYKMSVGDLDALSHPCPHPESFPTYWIYTVILSRKKSVSRKEVVLKLIDRRVGARAFWVPVHSLPYLDKYQSYRIENATRLYEGGICLPSSVGLTQEDQARVCEQLRNVLS